MPWSYGRRSLSRLATCHEDLQALMRAALEHPECPCDITIVEGHRGETRQNQMVQEGKSRLPWPRSRHNSTPSMAVDIAPYIDGTVSWSWDWFTPLGVHIKAVWAELQAAGRVNPRHKLTWGADWTGGFRDGPHFQIDHV